MREIRPTLLVSCKYGYPVYCCCGIPVYVYMFLGPSTRYQVYKAMLLQLLQPLLWSSDA